MPQQITASNNETDSNFDQLTNVATLALEESKRLGATQAEASVSAGLGLSATVRLGDVETIEHNRDKSLSLSVYFGHKNGSASTSDFSPAAVKDTVRAACTIAKYTGEDDCNGLADADRLATEFPDLDLYHPWNLTMDEAIDLAKQAEDAARNADPRIVNSEGGSASSHEGMEVFATSHGFLGKRQSSRHGYSCAVIGQNDGEEAMERDYWYDSARHREDLISPNEVGSKCAERALRRLGARKIKTQQSPVIYEAPIASSILGHLISAVSGGALYRKSSFLLDHLGEQIFPEHVHIHEQPYLKRAAGSSAYDNEGVTTRTRDIVKEGVLQSYVLSSYSARKLGLETTGNAGGVRNLTIDSSDKDLPELMRDMGTGLLVTELIGFGVNNVTGDYSRGAAGFWVENGEIQHPVSEITVAGNLKEIFKNLAAVGSDVDKRGNIRTGSLLIENLTIAGA